MKSPTLYAKQVLSWTAHRIHGIAATIDPELFEQEQGGPAVTRWGVINRVKGKAGKAQFGEFSGGSNNFAIERPSGGSPVDAARALENNKGFVYAAVNAKAREIMVIDWRLFEVKGDDNEEKKRHDLLDLLDAPNDNMTGLEMKYLTSACLDLTGNAYWYLQGVTGELGKPKALHLMPPDKVHAVIDRRTWPYQVIGYKMKLETTEMAFKPEEVIQFRLPNPANFFEGYSPVQAGAEFIDNDTYAMEFNRKFFINGARPAGFLESDFVGETQIDALKMGFVDSHAGIDNMNRIGVLPKGVKWSPSGASPKDMDFKNLSEDMRDRILAMFGVSRTILGTAESDTNRATAETADYVFSKRVVKPHMTLICAVLNDRLVPRYGDDLYISFIDPVPEDKAFRVTEMQAAVGSQPLMTANEGRDSYLGLGPVDGGDRLMAPTTMVPVGEAQAAGDAAPQPENDANAKSVRKDVKPNHAKAANGLRIGYRPARTKLQTLAKKRAEMKTELAKEITAKLKAKLDRPTKKFITTKEQDEAVYKEFSEYTSAAEKDFAETLRKLNAEQKAEVLDNLQKATKGVNPADLFDIDKWISITVDAMTPIYDTLFEHEAKQAMAEIGKPDMVPFSAAQQEALHKSVSMMAESYQKTTLATLETKINDGLSQGLPLADISKSVQEVYEWSDTWRADRTAKTEAFRTSNTALKSAWQQSGVVKSVKWYTANDPCPFCRAMEGKTIPVDQNFLENGDSLTVGEGENAQTMSLDYGDVGSPPLHPNCMCMIRPDEVSLD